MVEAHKGDQYDPVISPEDGNLAGDLERKRKDTARADRTIQAAVTRIKYEPRPSWKLKPDDSWTSEAGCVDMLDYWLLSDAFTRSRSTICEEGAPNEVLRPCRTCDIQRAMTPEQKIETLLGRRC